MAPRAAAEGRRRLSLAAVGLLAALLLSPTVEASRGLPAALAPALTSASTPDLVLSAELEDPPARLRLFDDLRLPPRPLELVEARKTATGFSTWNLGLNRLQIGGLSQNRSGLSFQGQWTDPVTGISYARNRWYDARTASWLSEDPMGAIDSPNLYAFVGWGPHAGRDPMGLHEFVEGEFRGYPATFARPTEEELAQGHLTVAITYDPWWWPGPITETISQHEGEELALLAKIPGNTAAKAVFELYYGVSVDKLPAGFWTLFGRGLWHDKDRIALTTLAGSTMIGRSPKPQLSTGSAAPRIDVAKPRPSIPKPPSQNPKIRPEASFSASRPQTAATTSGLEVVPRPGMQVRVVYTDAGVPVRIYGQAGSSSTTAGHSARIMREAIRMAKSGKYDYVVMQRSWRTATGRLASSGKIPDVIGVRSSGVVDGIEVASATDDLAGLQSRLIEGIETLPLEQRGFVRVVEPTRSPD